MIQKVLNQAEDSRCKGIPERKSYRGEESNARKEGVEKYFLPGAFSGEDF